MGWREAGVSETVGGSDDGGGANVGDVAAGNATGGKEVAKSPKSSVPSDCGWTTVEDLNRCTGLSS